MTSLMTKENYESLPSFPLGRRLGIGRKPGTGQHEQTGVISADSTC